jgi:hypothetical protein
MTSFFYDPRQVPSTYSPRPAAAVMGVTKQREMLRRIHRMEEPSQGSIFMRHPSSQDQSRHQKGLGSYYLGIENKQSFCGLR